MSTNWTTHLSGNQSLSVAKALGGLGYFASQEDCTGYPMDIAKRFEPADKTRKGAVLRVIARASGIQKPITIGDPVRVHRHTLYKSLVLGTVVNPPRKYEHPGYAFCTVSGIFDEREIEVTTTIHWDNDLLVDYVSDVYVEVLGDYTPLSWWEIAETRVNETPELDEYYDFIMADWPEGDGHWKWVATASVSEIVDWAQACGANNHD